ncbi:MAG: DUF3857 domain-containing protein, partial [Bacteroidales bacterium]|nr:DUF3857 domain-containing protein [Bacteroidales bacterium]
NFQEFKMYSDVRTLSFSMPAVDVGAVMDYEIEQTETKPVIPSQAWDTWQLRIPAPISGYKPSECRIFQFAMPG